jgi:O6-methylguanine-DNA--protein-cysteine methyltransferase
VTGYCINFRTLKDIDIDMLEAVIRYGFEAQDEKSDYGKKKQLTPQQKKKLSLAKDRRNTYGNNDKAARTGVRRRRAVTNRNYRRNVRQAISHTLAEADTPEEIDNAASKLRRKVWKKTADTPLGEVINRKMERRKRTGQNKG